MFFVKYGNYIAYDRKIYTGNKTFTQILQVADDNKIYIPNGENEHYITTKILLSNVDKSTLANTEYLERITNSFVGVVTDGILEHNVYYQYSKENKHELQFISRFAMQQCITGVNTISDYLSSCIDYLSTYTYKHLDDNPIDKVKAVVNHIAMLYNESSAYGVKEVVLINIDELRGAISNGDVSNVETIPVELTPIPSEYEVRKKYIESKLTDIPNVTSKKKRNKKVNKDEQLHSKDNVSA